MTDKKPWAGRFNEATDAFVEAFTASVEFDRRLHRHDIEGSIAHARMLARQGVPNEDHLAFVARDPVRLEVERLDLEDHGR